MAIKICVLLKLLTCQEYLKIIQPKTLIFPFGIQTDHYKQGMYILKVKGETIDQSLQVIKE